MALVAKQAGVNRAEALSLDTVRTSFQQWTNGSGKMSKADFRKMLLPLSRGHTEHDIDVLFSVADANRDGYLDLQELVTWLGLTLS